MKKLVVSSLILILMFSMLINSVFVLAHEDDNSGSTDAVTTDNSGSGDRIETRERTETTNEDGERIRTETRIRIRDGEIEREIRVRAEGEDAERIKKALEERNRLRIREAAGELPEGCSQEGNVLRCEVTGEDGVTRKTIRVEAGNSGNEVEIRVGESKMRTKVEVYHRDGKIYGVFNKDGNETGEAREIKVLPDEVREKIRARIKAHLEGNETIELSEDGNYDVEARKEARFLGLFKIRERINFEVDSETGDILRERARWWSFLSRDVIEDTTATSSDTSSTQ